MLITKMLVSQRCVAPLAKSKVMALVLSVAWVGTMYVYSTSNELITPRIRQVFSDTTTIPMDNETEEEVEPESQNRECMFPGTDPFDPTLNEIIKTYPPLDCSGGTPHVVYLENFNVKVNRTKVKQLQRPGKKFKNCRYKEIFRMRGSDKKVYFGRSSALFTDKIEVDSEHNNIVVECYYSDHSVMSRSYFALIRVNMETESYLKEKYEEHLRNNSPSETLNILMIGIDGMSRQNFERAMPKTRNFLLQDLGAIEFRKYNKLGFSTLPNVTPLLTGKTWNEIKDFLTVEKGFFDPVNHFFLWSKARSLGYRTGLALDNLHITSFHYQRMGFNAAPVDYYFRPTLLAWGPDRLMRGQDKNCLGDEPIVNQINDYWLQMARTFRSKGTPYFGYSFAAGLTHDDCNEASKGDNAYHQFLQDLVAVGGLNNTVLVWFSDHGQRFGRIRLTYQGRVETNTPYLFMVFPPWFKKKYPEAMRVFEMNKDRLTTHFDVYETLKDILYFQWKTGTGTIQERGISLFKEIPRERTCPHAGIPEEFCACAHFSQPVLNSEVLSQLSSALLARVNSFTEHISDRCSRFTLEFINDVHLVRTNSPRTRQSQSFRMILTVKPGGGKFEGLVELNKKTGDATVVGEVVRTNLYRGQADCVEDATLRQFCFCTEK